MAPSLDEVLSDIFEIYDVDGSGYIEQGEGLAIAHHMGYNKDKQNFWQNMLNDMDEDGDGKISRAEYIAFNKKTQFLSLSRLCELKNELLSKGIGSHVEATAQQDQIVSEAVAKAAAETAALAASYEPLTTYFKNNKQMRTYYTNNGNEQIDPDFFDALTVDPELGGAPVRLLDAHFLIALAKHGGVLLRRQDLPDAAFIELSVMKTMWCNIVCISHPWLQPDTPDPKGENLRLIAKVLQAMHDNRQPYSQTFAVFLDFSSLYQNGRDGLKRSASEAALFGKALNSLSDWYSSPKTDILKVTSLPPGYPAGFNFPSGSTPNQADYHGRGWCYCEASVANLVKSDTKVLDLGNLQKEPLPPGGEAWWVVSEQCTSGRSPPLLPAEFAKEVETKSFTSKKADLGKVTKLYTDAFTKRMAEVTELSTGNGWGDEELKVLARTLDSGAAPKLEILGLVSDESFGSEGICALFAALGRAVAPNLQRLLLIKAPNCGDAGVAALAAALRNGALSKLSSLTLENSGYGDGGFVPLCEALAGGAAPALTRLDVRGNSIGNQGAKALGDAIASGSLRRLEQLTVKSNEIGDIGFRVLSEGIYKAMADGLTPKLEDPGGSSFSDNRVLTDAYWKAKMKKPL